MTTVDFCPPHSHCHWTYKRGRYVSFQYWPTREGVELAVSYARNSRIVEPPEIYQVHTPGCACEPEMENA